MDFTKTADAPSPARHDGWTGELKARFLDHLAETGNVRSSCGRVRMSAQAAYRLRRRDPLFARAWAAALALAREAGAEVLATRAIDGVTEEVWHRGEMVGTRRRFDTRLLLAHLARLDRLVDETAAGEDAGRFDELVARVAGEELPADLPSGEDRALPLAREKAADAIEKRAVSELLYEDDDTFDEEEGEFEEDEGEAAFEQRVECIRAEGEARWDDWFDHACAVVDRATAWRRPPPLPGLPGSLSPALAAIGGGSPAAGFSPPCTVSLVSTSALARALAGPRPFAVEAPRSPFASAR